MTSLSVTVLGCIILLIAQHYHTFSQYTALYWSLSNDRYHLYSTHERTKNSTFFSILKMVLAALVIPWGQVLAHEAQAVV